MNTLNLNYNIYIIAGNILAIEKFHMVCLNNVYICVLQIKDLLGEVRKMAATNADTHTICKRIEKIEMLEQEKACHLSRLLKEKEMLLQKVNELGEAMKEIENPT